MMKYPKLTHSLSVFSVIFINLLQLFQVLSFLKNTPKEKGWGSSIDSFISDTKKLSLRSDDDSFLSLYLTFNICCILSFVLYILFYSWIHGQNKIQSFFTIFQYFCESFIFAIGYIPMISKFTEVQICDMNLSISSYNRISCFKDTQMLLVQLGYMSTGVAFIFNGVIIPTLKYERQGIERMWSKECYFEGLYYLVLLFSVSFLTWIHKPWVGALICGLGFSYGIIFNCYESLIVACSRCAVLATLFWVFTSAWILEDHDNIGRILLYCAPLGYFSGFLVKFVRHKLINK